MDSAERWKPPTNIPTWFWLACLMVAAAIPIGAPIIQQVLPILTRTDYTSIDELKGQKFENSPVIINGVQVFFDYYYYSKDEFTQIERVKIQNIIKLVTSTGEFRSKPTTNLAIYISSNLYLKDNSANGLNYEEKFRSPTGEYKSTILLPKLGSSNTPGLNVPEFVEAVSNELREQIILDDLRTNVGNKEAVEVWKSKDYQIFSYVLDEIKGSAIKDATSLTDISEPTRFNQNNLNSRFDQILTDKFSLNFAKAMQHKYNTSFYGNYSEISAQNLGLLIKQMNEDLQKIVHNPAIRIEIDPDYQLAVLKKDTKRIENTSFKNRFKLIDKTAPTNF